MTAPTPNPDAADLDAAAAPAGKPDTAPKATEPKADDWKPPASQADFDRIIQDRLTRERAKFTDYDALKEKAAYWDELEQASKTEFEQQAEMLQEAEGRYAQATARIVKAELKAAGVPTELIEDLDLSRFVDGDGEIAEDRIEAMREKYAALAPQGSPRMAPNPAQGTSAQPPLSLNERIAQAQQAGDSKTVMRLKAAQAMNTN